MGSQYYLPPDIAERDSPLTPARQTGTHLSIPEG